MEAYDFNGKTVIPFATSGGCSIKKACADQKAAYLVLGKGTPISLGGNAFHAGEETSETALVSEVQALGDGGDTEVSSLQEP